MVASASYAGFDCTVETFERVSADDGLRFRETGFRGPETTRPKSPRGPNWSQQRPNRPRQCPPIAGHSEAARKSPGSRECVVVDAVLIGPVSTPNSLLTGKLTG